MQYFSINMSYLRRNTVLVYKNISGSAAVLVTSMGVM